MSMNLGYRLARSAIVALGAETAQRTYQAAGVGRMTGSWTTTNSSANQEIKNSLRVMRARARQLARDDDYFKGFLDKLVVNVIGRKGICLQSQAKAADGETQNDAVNKPLETAWLEYSKKQNCSVDGQSSMRDIQGLALRTMATDGECLIRMVIDGRNPYKMGLQFIDADWLDEDYNDPQDYRTGNRIIMSVEVDTFDRPVAYYFTRPRWANVSVPEYAGNLVGGGADRIRVPAKEIIHLFMRTRPGQVRGMTWAHTAMTRLNMLNGYEESELVKKRVEASQMAWVIPPTDDAGLGGNPGVAPDAIEQEVTAGMITQLPAGYTVQTFEPKSAGTTYAVYVKQILRAIAGGLGMSYNTMASDLESTSYSSMRAGSLDDRDQWRCFQEWLSEHLCQAIYDKWLVLNIDSPTLSIPAVSIVDLGNPIWKGRGFDWVDPSKDAKADITVIDAGIKTRTEVMAERGRDFEEVMLEFAYEKKFMEGLGLSFGADKAALDQLDQIAASNDAADAAAKEKAKSANAN